MIRVLAFAWIFFAAVLAQADLPGEIRAVLADKLLSKAQVGIDIVELGKSAETSTRLYAQNENQLFAPASNLKVLTTSAAIDRLGTDFKFKTRFCRINDSLAIVGDGDPTLGDAELLHKANWVATTTFTTWAEAIKKQSISSFTNLLLDDSIFDETALHPDWPIDQVDSRYMAGVSGLNLNANCIDFYIRPRGEGAIVDFVTEPSWSMLKVANTCVLGRENRVVLARKAGSDEIILKGTAIGRTEVPIHITVPDPTLYTGQVLADVLVKNGIAMKGEIKRERTIRATLDKPESPATLLAVLETPLFAVIDRANKDSMNLYAEALCKRMGAQSGSPGSWDNGPKAVGEFLAKIGIPAGQFDLVDGSGLSKKNRASPNAFMQVLQHNYFGPNRDSFIASLAVGGVDGTLDERFRNDLKGRVHAKSGFIKGVSCLSGYLQAKTGQWVAFSILINGIPDGSNSGIKPIQEKIVKLVDHHLSAK